MWLGMCGCGLRRWGENGRCGFSLCRWGEGEGFGWGEGFGSVLVLRCGLRSVSWHVFVDFVLRCGMRFTSGRVLVDFVLRCGVRGASGRVHHLQLLLFTGYTFFRRRHAAPGGNPTVTDITGFSRRLRIRWRILAALLSVVGACRQIADHIHLIHMHHGTRFTVRVHLGVVPFEIVLFGEGLGEGLGSGGRRGTGLIVGGWDGQNIDREICSNQTGWTVSRLSGQCYQIGWTVIRLGRQL